MHKWIPPTLVAAAFLVMAGASIVAAESPSKDSSKGNISVRAIAEVEVRVPQNGRVISKLMPADRVVPGDEVIYTLEIRNTVAMALPPPTVDYPVPEHLSYVADSASGPGADVSYSIDGGQTFDRPENLKVIDAQGVKHTAGPELYTHIRWQLKHILKANSFAFARFRAVVK